MIKISELLKIHKLKSKIEYIAEEIHRSARFGYNFGIIIIVMRNGISDITSKRSSDKRLEFSMMKEHLRPYDQIVSDDKGKYCIILPQTNGIGSSIVRERIYSLCHKYNLKNVLLGTAIYPHDGTSATKLLDAASERLKSFKENDENSPIEKVELHE